MISKFEKNIFINFYFEIIL